MGAESKVLTYSDVSAHNTSEDCWIIINGKVRIYFIYNISSGVYVFLDTKKIEPNIFLCNMMWNFQDKLK